jgi:hypothetical protein
VITFRYHIVSLVAVFLALAVGIVVGTTALNGPVTSDLRRQVDDLKKTRTQLADQTKLLQGEVDSANQFATAYGSQIVSNSLKDQNILIVVLPGVSSSIQDGISADLTAAGATITGKLVFTPAFIDPGQQTSITTMVTDPSIRPYGLADLPTTSDAGILGGTLLAYVLTGQGQPTDIRSVLTAFAGLHLISSDPSKIGASPNVLVLGTGAQSSSSYAGQTEFDLVSALGNRQGKVVVAGDSGSAASTGVVGLLRASTSKNVVSSVDNADTAVGQISATLAMAHAVAGQVGQYGGQKGAQALFPTPAS